MAQIKKKTANIYYVNTKLAIMPTLPTLCDCEKYEYLWLFLDILSIFLIHLFYEKSYTNDFCEIENST